MSLWSSKWTPTEAVSKALSVAAHKAHEEEHSVPRNPFEQHVRKNRAAAMPVGQIDRSDFETATWILLKGNGFERIISKEPFLSACPQLKARVRYNDTHGFEVDVGKTRLQSTTLGLMADFFETGDYSDGYGPDAAISASEAARLCKIHTAIYFASETPLHSSTLQTYAIDRFLERLKQALRDEQFPDEVCLLFQRLVDCTDIHDTIFERALPVLMQRYKSISRTPKLVQLLQQGYGWVWHLAVQMHEWIDVSSSKLMDMRAHGLKVCELLEEANKKIEHLEQELAGRKTLEQHKATISGPQIDCLTQELNDVKKSNDDLRRNLDTANAVTEGLKNTLTRANGQCAQANKDTELAKAAMFISRNEVAKLKDELAQANENADAAHVASKSMVNDTQTQVAAENAKLKAQLAENSTTAHARRTAMLQKEVEILKTKLAAEVQQVEALKTEMADGTTISRARTASEEPQITSLNSEHLDKARNSINSLVAHVSDMRAIAQVLCSTTNIEALQQELEEAKEACKAHMRCASMLEKELQKSEALRLQAEQAVAVARRGATTVTQNEEAAQKDAKTADDSADNTTLDDPFVTAFKQAAEQSQKELADIKQQLETVRQQYQSLEKDFQKEKTRAAKLQSQVDVADRNRSSLDDLASMKSAFDRANNNIRRTDECDYCENEITFDLTHSGFRSFGLECRDCGERVLYDY